MAEKKPQVLANHARLDPLYHFIALPVFGLGAIAGMVHFIWHPSAHSAAFFVVSVAGAIAVLKVRTYALKVQDRVIRLEERLRLASLLPEPLRARIPELTEGQLIALRFASDDEVVALAKEALEKNLTRKQIKERIRDWRPDEWRV